MGQMEQSIRKGAHARAKKNIELNPKVGKSQEYQSKARRIWSNIVKNQTSYIIGR